MAAWVTQKSLIINDARGDGHSDTYSIGKLFTQTDRNRPMPDQRDRLTMSVPAQYRVRVQGVIERRWVDQLARMKVAYRNVGRVNAVTVLTSDALDQAGLLGLLNQLYGLGLPLVSVQWLRRAV
jgi:hypothetical protein